MHRALESQYSPFSSFSRRRRRSNRKSELSAAASAAAAAAASIATPFSGPLSGPLSGQLCRAEEQEREKPTTGEERRPRRGGLRWPPVSRRRLLWRALSVAAAACVAWKIGLAPRAARKDCPPKDGVSVSPPSDAVLEDEAMFSDEIMDSWGTGLAYPTATATAAATAAATTTTTSEKKAPRGRGLHHQHRKRDDGGGGTGREELPKEGPTSAAAPSPVVPPVPDRNLPPMDESRRRRQQEEKQKGGRAGGEVGSSVKDSSDVNKRRRAERRRQRRQDAGASEVAKERNERGGGEESASTDVEATKVGKDGNGRHEQPPPNSRDSVVGNGHVDEVASSSHKAPRKSQRDYEGRRPWKDLPPWDPTEYMEWARYMGVECDSVRIEYFDYATRGGPKSLRGLAAARNIDAGEVIISVPFSSMISLASIESDPILSPILGSQARHNHDILHTLHPWTDEIQLLTVYLLFRFSTIMTQGKDGNDSNYNTFFHTLLSVPVDTMPFLWTREELHRTYPDPADGIRVAAEAILYDVREMYEEIIPPLVQSYPEIFAPKRGEEGDANNMSKSRNEGGDANTNKRPLPTEDRSTMAKTDRGIASTDREEPTTGTTREDAKAEEVNGNDDWPYSFEQFLWAYAVVNSRHWSLPCADVDTALQVPTMVAESNGDLASAASADDGGKDDISSSQLPLAQHHSWMAPVADMLNFGPACTRAEYVPSSRTFNIVATCNLVMGQEVTFWYTDECEDVVVANFGFTSPLIDKCLSTEEWMDRSEQWQAHAEMLEKRLLQAWEEADGLRKSLEEAKGDMEGCCGHTGDGKVRGGGMRRDVNDEGL